MRKGQNPIKQLQSVAKPQRVTAAVLNHIPFLDGFYADLLQVLDTSLGSLRENAGMPFDLLVYDNGSCAEARAYLLREFEQGRIQILILAEHNMGKGGAWNVMLQAAPGEIVAYADNDVLYYPGWLVESVKVLEAYPNVGMVTARPYYSKPDLYSASVDWATQTAAAQVERGRLIEPLWVREFLLSLGRTKEEIAAELAEENVRITYNDVTTFCGASHWQFVAWKKVLQEFLPIDLTKPMGQVLRLDQMVNERGYLRLMTDRPYVMNMSNTVELPGASASKVEKKAKKRLVDYPLIKSPLMRIYNAIFGLYYKNEG